jgi:hypothetical protein
LLAEELDRREKLQLEEAFIGAFYGGNKGGLAVGPSAARGRKSSLGPIITVFLSPLVSKALLRTKAHLLKGFSATASSSTTYLDD